MNVITSSQEVLAISFTQQFEVTKLMWGGLKVTTLAYEYAIENSDGHEILAYHWHPHQSDFTFPHLHVCHGAGTGLRDEIRKIHFRTDRMAFEDFGLQLIRDFGVVPDREDAESVLEANLAKFTAHRSWK